VHDAGARARLRLSHLDYAAIVELRFSVASPPKYRERRQRLTYRRNLGHARDSRTLEPWPAHEAGCRSDVPLHPTV